MHVIIFCMFFFKCEIRIVKCQPVRLKSTAAMVGGGGGGGGGEQTEKGNLKLIRMILV